MSYIPFTDLNVAASTLTNLAIYKKQVTIPSVGTPPLNIPLVDTEAYLGSFVPLQVFFHVEDNGGNNQLQFTCSIGTYNSGTFDNICASAVRGTTTTTAALQLRQYKAVVFPVRAASSYYNQAFPRYFGGQIILRLTAYPAASIVGTFCIVGYYTEVR